MTAGCDVASADRLAAEAALARVRATIGPEPARAGLALDFDGTISPIVPTPDAATVHPRAREALARLAPRLGLVAVVSGRPVADLRARVGLDGLVYVGSHGAERWPPAAGRPSWSSPSATSSAAPGEGVRGIGAAPALAALEERLGAALARRGAPAGLLFERKPAGLAVHFRLATDPRRALWAVRRAVRDADAVALGFRHQWGKCVLELLPADAPTKGNALADLAQADGLAALVYLGDDRTDVDAFRALRRLGRQLGLRTLSVAVSGAETPPALLRLAEVVLPGVSAAAHLLAALAEALARPAPPPSAGEARA